MRGKLAIHILPHIFHHILYDWLKLTRVSLKHVGPL